MKSKFQKILFIIITISTIVLFAPAYKNYKTEQLEKEKQFFIENLTSFIVPHITFDDAEYNIKDGNIVLGKRHLSLKKQVEILSIGYYSVLTRLDPLFAIPGTNLDALRMIRCFAHECERIRKFSQ